MSRASEAEAFLKADEQHPNSRASMADQALNALSGLGQDVADGIPGYSALVAKVGGMLPGQTEQGVAESQQAAREQGVVPHVVGNMAGGMLAGAGAAALTAATAGGAAPILGAAGATAVAGAESALMVPGYKLGEIANQAQLRAAPLRLEQITHALFSHETAIDMLKAMGLTWVLGAAGMGLEAAGTASKGLAGRMAVKQATKLYVDAAEQMRLPAGVGDNPHIGATDLGQLALEKDLLKNAGRTRTLKEQAGAHLESSAEKIPVDEAFQADVAEQLDELTQQHSYNANLKGPIRYLARQSAALSTRELDGPQLQSIAQGLKQKATAAFDAKQPQKGQFYSDAAETVQNALTEQLKIFDPQAGASYETAVADYWTYANMQRASERGVKKQFTKSDALVGALGAGAGIGASKLLGPQAAGLVEGALGLAGVQRFGGKNYATLLDAYSKAPPFATFLRNTSKVVSGLLNPANVAQVSSTKQDAVARYDELAHALRVSSSDPGRTIDGIKQKLSFLPPIQADAIAANTANKLQEAALQLPPSTGPVTAFGVQTGATDRDKRAFVEKFDAKFDPYGAFLSGRPDLIAEAEKHNPETTQHVRQILLEELAKRTDIPYSTRRKLSGILGVAGVPMQDPALGAKLQQIITTKREAEGQAGQIGSARQAAAAMKNNKATLSRAQGILNQEGQ